jgi:hypothetical protein
LLVIKPAPSSLKDLKQIKSKFFSGFYLWHFQFHFLFLKQTKTDFSLSS